MNSKTLVGTVAALALGLTGAAAAQSDTGQSGSKSGTSGSERGSSATGSSAGEETGASATGSKGAPSKSGMSEKSAMGKASDIPSIKLSALDESQVTDLQTRLQELGFYKGEVDGKAGRLTRAALSQWFRQQLNLINQGRVSEAGLSGLGFSDTDIERVRGVDEESGTSTGTSGSGTSGSGTQGGSDKSGKY